MVRWKNNDDNQTVQGRTTDCNITIWRKNVLRTRFLWKRSRWSMITWSPNQWSLVEKSDLIPYMYVGSLASLPGLQQHREQRSNQTHRRHWAHHHKVTSSSSSSNWQGALYLIFNRSSDNLDEQGGRVFRLRRGCDWGDWYLWGQREPAHLWTGFSNSHSSDENCFRCTRRPSSAPTSCRCTLSTARWSMWLEFGRTRVTLILVRFALSFSKWGIWRLLSSLFFPKPSWWSLTLCSPNMS